MSGGFWRESVYSDNAVFVEALREFLGLAVLDNQRVCGCMRSREWEAVLPIRDDFSRLRLPTARDRRWNMRNMRARMAFDVR